MTIDDVIRRLAYSGDSGSDETALQGFVTAARRVDDDPREARRIRGLAESVDAEIAAYDQGLAALDRGDSETAESLLRQAVAAQHGDAEDLLAELLVRTPEGATPLDLSRSAAETRAYRAILNAAYRRNSAGAAVTSGRRPRRPRLRLPWSGPRLTANDLADVLMTALEAKDAYTRAHSERIGRLVTLIGHRLEMRPGELEAARLAGVFHDIGKLTIPNVVLRKSTLTEEEFALIQLHVMRGVEIVRQMPEFFDQVPGEVAREVVVADTMAGIRYHHERFDGRGYPFGLAGEEIPRIARVVAVADAFDAMTTFRSYRAARSLDEAAAELRRCAGVFFDPQMVEAFLDVLDGQAEEVEKITRGGRPLAAEPDAGRTVRP